ncbi:MAG: DUF6596 domain-containing protein [Gaiellales bacterium]
MTDLEALYRDEWARSVAILTRIVGDLSLAEDAVQDAFATAHERWPQDGAPRSPAAWIVATARNRAIDRIRRDRAFRDKAAVLARLAEPEESTGGDPMIGDERLALVFTCCHPALGLDGQVALTLREVGGLATPEIARAFLVSEQTMAQRLVRAKRRIREAGIPFRTPVGPLLHDRLPGVLRVLYLVFNEGYAATSGDTPLRRDLCAEAIRLIKLVCVLLPEAPEAFGLLALMLLTDARRDARVDSEGNLVLLADQDQTRWDVVEIDEGMRHLERARSGAIAGPYRLQAEIAAGHVGRNPAAAVADAYERLELFDPSPIVKLNHAVSLALAGEVERGLGLIEALTGLESYHYWWGARADLLRRLDRHAEARAAYGEALRFVDNAAERRFYERRVHELEG